MDRQRVLFSWIGHTDLRAMAGGLPPKKRTDILAILPDSSPPPDERGPVKTLVESVAFDEVHLLSNYPADPNREFARWLGRPVNVIQVELSVPTDYERIFTIADQELGKVRKRSDWANIDLCIHLSPGTPAMASVWLLLGKTRYPATFYQTFKGTASVTNVPFDLTLDFLPELLRAPDTHWQHLSAQSPGEVAGFEKIIGDSKPIRLAVGRAQRAAIRSVPVLLLGESGTGKELFARAIHDASARRNGPFIVINCAAIARELLESELFGHMKGAFSGATADRKGAFEEADGGTLFLDEIGECDLDLQAKLLRVLQPLSDSGPCQRAYRRVGESKDRATDVRIIAATNRDLVQAIQDGRFRDDLYYRLAVVTIGLPALRERKADIPKIAEAKMEQINREFTTGEPGYRDKKISDSAISFVKRYGWPGNVRQLHNALLQAAVMANGTVLQRDDILAAVGTMPDLETGRNGSLDEELGNGFDLEEHLNNIRKHYLRRAMEESRGVKAEASRMLGFVNYQTLDAQLKRLNVTGNWR